MRFRFRTSERARERSGNQGFMIVEIIPSSLDPAERASCQVCVK